MGEVLLGKGEILKKLNAPEMYFWHLGSVVIGTSMLLRLFICFVIQI